MVILGLAVAGGLGAVLRWLVSIRLAGRGIPRGVATATVNLGGAFALGVVAALGERGWIDQQMGVVVGTGLLGALTTFSTWMVQTLEESGGKAPAVLGRTVLPTVAGVVLAWLGVQVANLLG